MNCLKKLDLTIVSPTILSKRTGFIFGVFLLGIVLFSLVESGQAQMPSMGPPAVRVETVGTLATSQPKQTVGFVTAKETVQIVPRVSGYLANIAFQEGGTVKEGDLLFEIEDTVYEINVRTAESVMRQIEAEIKLSENDLARTRQLHAQNAATEQEMDQALRNIELNKARLDEARASLDRAKNDLSYTKIYAPLTGKIGAKTFSRGNYITPSSGVLATIVQYDPIRVSFPVSEQDLADYFQESDGLFRMPHIEVLRANYKKFENQFKLDFVDNMVEQKSGTVMVHLLCDNPNTSLNPGGYAPVRLSVRYEKPMPSVPVSSLMTDGTKHYVYVVDEKKIATRHDVVLGHQVFDHQVVFSGVDIGDRVIAGGLNKVRPGQEVRPMDPTRPGSAPGDAPTVPTAPPEKK